VTRSCLLSWSGDEWATSSPPFLWSYPLVLLGIKKPKYLRAFALTTAVTCGSFYIADRLKMQRILLRRFHLSPQSNHFTALYHSTTFLCCLHRQHAFLSRSESRARDTPRDLECLARVKTDDQHDDRRQRRCLPLSGPFTSIIDFLLYIYFIASITFLISDVVWRAAPVFAAKHFLHNPFSGKTYTMLTRFALI